MNSFYFPTIFKTSIKIKIFILIDRLRIVTKIHRRLGSDHSTISQHIKELELQGLIRRSKRGRVNYISYTNKGIEVFKLFKEIERILKNGGS